MTRGAAVIGIGLLTAIVCRARHERAPAASPATKASQLEKLRAGMIHAQQAQADAYKLLEQLRAQVDRETAG